MDDLSRQHGPVSSLFPRAGDRAGEYGLDHDQIEEYAKRGFVAGIRVLEDHQVEALLRDLEQWSNPEHAHRELWYEYRSNASADPDRVMLHASGAWRLSVAFHDLLWHPAITAPARQLLQAPVRFLQDQLFCKPPSRGGCVSWHQDYSYWTFSQPIGHLACWIALDDATVENGCLQYVPGSHEWGLLPITGLTGAMGAIHAVLTPEQREAFTPVPVELKRGQAAFHHPLIVHGSYENRSGRPRRAAVINFMRDGTRAAVEEPETDGLPAFMTRRTEDTIFYPPQAPSGRVLDGRFFPLVG